MEKYKNVAEYLERLKGGTFPKEVLAKVLEIRKIVKSIIKGKENYSEEIKYGIPTLVLKIGKKNKNILHYGGFKKHVSIFPGQRVIDFLKKELENFETSKGTIKFPLGKKLSLILIKKIIRFCLENNR